MKKGQMLPTTTEVLNHFVAEMDGKYFGTATLLGTQIDEICYIYTVEYDSRKLTSMGIEHEMFGDSHKAKDFYAATVKSIKMEVLEYLQEEIA